MTSSARHSTTGDVFAMTSSARHSTLSGYAKPQTFSQTKGSDLSEKESKPKSLWG